MSNERVLVEFFVDEDVSPIVLSVVYDADGPDEVVVGLGTFRTKAEALSAMDVSLGFLEGRKWVSAKIIEPLLAAQAVALESDGNLGLPQQDATSAPQAAESSSGRVSWRERAKARRRAGKKPRRPRRQKARKARVGFPPPSTIWDVSYQCVKCGRTLTNPNSQRHRVGSDCIKRYGSQARKIANPAHQAWADRKIRAEANQIAQQMEYDAAYATQKAEYERTLATWRLVRAGRLPG